MPWSVFTSASADCSFAHQSFPVLLGSLGNGHVTRHGVDDLLDGIGRRVPTGTIDTIRLCTDTGFSNESACPPLLTSRFLLQRALTVPGVHELDERAWSSVPGGVEAGSVRSQAGLSRLNSR